MKCRNCSLKINRECSSCFFDFCNSCLEICIKCNEMFCNKCRRICVKCDGFYV